MYKNFLGQKSNPKEEFNSQLVCQVAQIHRYRFSHPKSGISELCRHPPTNPPTETPAIRLSMRRHTEETTSWAIILFRIFFFIFIRFFFFEPFDND